MQKERENQWKEERIRGTIENNKNSKRLNRELSLGSQLTTFLVDKKGTRVYDRYGINRIATEYYTELYSSEPSHERIFQISSTS